MIESTLKLDLLSSSEKFVSIYKTTRHEPENGGGMLLWNFVSHLQDYTV
jgi:hypothetical protein